MNHIFISYINIVYFNDVLVGGVCTRIENNVDLYVMSITVLKPYRRMKIGLLNEDKKHY